jgi:hypothetical protein
MTSIGEPGRPTASASVAAVPDTGPVPDTAALRTAAAIAARAETDRARTGAAATASGDTGAFHAALVDTGTFDSGAFDGGAFDTGTVQAVPSRTDRGGTGDSLTRPGRVLLGLAVLAGERLRAGAGTPDRVATAVGLVERAAEEAGALARRAATPPARLVVRTGEGLSRLPGVRLVAKPVARGREKMAAATARATVRGRASVAAGRADALVFVRRAVDDGLSWAEGQAVPHIVDALVPHLVAEVVPRIIDGTMPRIRAEVLPVVIGDLTADESVRDLVVTQGRGVIGDTAEQLRSSTAEADDRVESVIRRLFGG